MVWDPAVRIFEWSIGASKTSAVVALMLASFFAALMAGAPLTPEPKRDVLLFLAPDSRLDKNVFLEQWKSLTTEHRADVQGLANENVEAICPKMEAANVFFIARRKLPDGADMVYFSCKTLNNVTMLAELGFRPGTGTCSISLKSAQGLYMPLLAESLQKILRS